MIMTNCSVDLLLQCVCASVFNNLTLLSVYSQLSFLFYDIQVHDVRFQTQTAEEKEAWIRALSNGIGRAKNKIFDEVYISIFFVYNMAGGKRFWAFSEGEL